MAGREAKEMVFCCSNTMNLDTGAVGADPFRGNKVSCAKQNRKR